MIERVLGKTVVAVAIAVCGSATLLFGQETQRLRNDAGMSWNAPSDSTIPGDLVAWVRSNAVPIRSLTSSDFSDLRFLEDDLEGVRIVQLGESGHGMVQANLLRARLVRFLYERLDFDVLVFESSLYQCDRADRLAADADPAMTVYACLFGVWHTTEMRDLFQFMAGTRNTEKPLNLAGMDIQQIGAAKRFRPEFLRSAIADFDPVAADSAFRLDSLYVERYGEGSRARNAFFRANKDALVHGYDYVRRVAGLYVSDLMARGATGAELRDARVARQVAGILARFVDSQTTDDAVARSEIRDSVMAENLRFLAEELYPGRKIIVWGHNAHLRHANEAIPPSPDGYPTTQSRAMGTWTHERYGEDVFTIGFYAHSGTAFNNRRDAYVVETPEPGTLESVLAMAGLKTSYFNLRNATHPWVRSETVARYNGLNDQLLRPADQYDAILFMSEVTPPEFLY